MICNEALPVQGKGFQARELGVPTVSDEQFMRSVGSVAGGIGIDQFEQPAARVSSSRCSGLETT